MAHYIDKSAVVAEIERLISDGQTKLKESEECKDLESYVALAERIATCINVLSFLDTLEVKDDVVSNDTLISPELLTAAAAYGREQLANPDYPTYNDEYELLCAFEAGAQWQKERMLNSAIEREVKVDAGGYPYIDATELYDYNKDKPIAKKGDKVKLIIIKDE